jgi:hypothetical protein
MPHFAAHSLIDACQTQVARVFNSINLLLAKQLNQHGIEQLGARTDDDVVGIDVHTPRPAKMVRNCAPQPSGALRGRGREDFALVFGRQRRPQSALPEARGFQSRRRERGELLDPPISIMFVKTRRSGISIELCLSRSQNRRIRKLASVVAATRL